MVIETWLLLSELKLIYLLRTMLNYGPQTWLGGPCDRPAHDSPDLGTVTLGQDQLGVVSISTHF